MRPHPHRDKILTAYLAGEKVSAIVAKYGCCLRTPTNAAKRDGHARRKTGRPPHPRATEIAEAYAQGTRTCVLAERYGCHPTGIRYIVKACGYPLRPARKPKQ